MTAINESQDDEAARAAWIERSKTFYSPTFGQGFADGLAHARANPQPVEYSGIVGDDAEYFGAREA